MYGKLKAKAKKRRILRHGTRRPQIYDWGSTEETKTVSTLDKVMPRILGGLTVIVAMAVIAWMTMK